MMSKSGVVHNKNFIDSHQFGLDALNKIKAESGLYNQEKKKINREPFYAHKVIIDGFKPTLKNGLKKPVTYIEQIDRKGRTVLHYMAECEETGKIKPLSKFKNIEG